MELKLERHVSIVGGGLCRCKGPAGTAGLPRWGGWVSAGGGAGAGSSLGVPGLGSLQPVGTALRARQLSGLLTTSETLNREYAASRVEKTAKSKLTAVALDTDRLSFC